MKKHYFNKFFTLLLMSLILTTSLITPVFAKNKTITLKKDAIYEQDKSVIDKLAITVKNGNTYTIKNKLINGAAVLKFTVPSNGTYEFKAWDYKKKESGRGLAYITFRKADSKNKVISDVNVRTKGGLTNTLWIGNYNDTNRWTGVKNKVYTKRTGTVTLSKGQVIYIWLSGQSYDKSYKLSIKKKGKA